jgi:hypothetical protein
MTYLLFALLSIAAGMALHGLALLVRRLLRSTSPSSTTTDTPRPLAVPVNGGRATLYGIAGGVAVGFTLLGWSVFSTARVDLDDWTQTTGTITRNERFATEANRGFSFSGQVTEDLYYVRLEYEYTTADATYTGFQRVPNEMLFDGEYLQLEAEEFETVQDEYPLGESVTVYYNPDDPSEAALEADNATPYLVLGAGLGTVAGLIAGVFALPVALFLTVGRRGSAQ